MIQNPPRIAIVGTCPSSAGLAPYDDESWAIWSCSPGNVDKMPRVDAWFELHGDLGWEGAPEWEHPYLRWLNAQRFDLFAQRMDLFPRRQNLFEFPKTRMLEEFGPYWFTSTPAWMMAFAITLKPVEIALYGLDMAATSEYARQKPGMIWFVDAAARRGIQVYVPAESDLLRPPPLYGYSVSTPFGQKLAVREREIKARIAAAQARRAGMVSAMDQEIIHLTGTLDQIDYDINTWTGEPVPTAAPAEVVHLMPLKKEN